MVVRGRARGCGSNSLEICIQVLTPNFKCSVTLFRFIAGLGIQCYVCGENSDNVQCNETYKGVVTACAYDDQSCVATVGEFGDVMGKLNNATHGIIPHVKWIVTTVLLGFASKISSLPLAQDCRVSQPCRRYFKTIGLRDFRNRSRFFLLLLLYRQNIG